MSRPIFHFAGARFQHRYQLAQFGQNLRMDCASFEITQTLSFSAKLAGGLHIKPRLFGRGRADAPAYTVEWGLPTFHS
jgi:hypothetical protein